MVLGKQWQVEMGHVGVLKQKSGCLGFVTNVVRRERRDEQEQGEYQ